MNYRDRKTRIQHAAAYFKSINAESLNSFCESVRIIGNGSTATVACYQIKEIGFDFALKFVNCSKFQRGLSFPMFETNVRMQIIEKIEATILHFITDRLLVHSPHFCALFAYCLGSTSFRHSTFRTHPSKDPSLIMISELATNTLSGYVFSLLSKDDFSGFISMILQVFMAIGALGSVGIEHNDLFTRNILLFDYDKVIRYHFGGSDWVQIKTCGQLVAFCDFGLASHSAWINDPRVNNASTLSDYYYNSDNVVRQKPRSLFILNRNRQVISPLSFAALSGFQRDFASFCTEIITLLNREKGTVATEAICRYLRTVLATLIDTDTSTCELAVDFVKRVTDYTFVSKHTEHEHLLLPFEYQFCENADVYSFPTVFESQDLSNTLCNLLSETIPLNTFIA
jgi:serine/threonine protein kinase